MNYETRQCQNCQKDFLIEPEDFSFYEKIKVPPPTFCPECRMQRRLTWRNEHNLHFRVCDATGKKLITIYSPEKDLKIYDYKYWWSDAWNQNDSALEYDFSKPFFEQFKDLIKRAPRPNLLQTNVINGEYSNYMVDSRNLYMVFSGVRDENDLYCIGSVIDTKDSLDIHLSSKIENSYWLVECNQSSGTLFGWRSDGCLDSVFLIDCKNCSNCFCCVGLRNQSYCIFNKQYGKEEYKKMIAQYNLGSYSSLGKLKSEFFDFALKVPFKYANINKSTNCVGDNIFNAKNCKRSFYMRDNVENCKYSYRVFTYVKDGIDLTLLWDNMELSYESLSVTTGSRVFFSSLCWNAQDVWYSDNCFNSKNVFGCVGLKNAQYCILNKQYTKEQYEELLPKIVKQMNDMPYMDKKRRRYKYGEFFPIELSPFPYNESLAQQYFTLPKEKISEDGYSYSEPEKRNYNITLAADKIQDDIKDVDESILN